MHRTVCPAPRPPRHQHPRGWPSCAASRLLVQPRQSRTRGPDRGLVTRDTSVPLSSSALRAGRVGWRAGGGWAGRSPAGILLKNQSSWTCSFHSELINSLPSCPEITRLSESREHAGGGGAAGSPRKVSRAGLAAQQEPRGLQQRGREARPWRPSSPAPLPPWGLRPPPREARAEAGPRATAQEARSGRASGSGPRTRRGARTHRVLRRGNPGSRIRGPEFRASPCG